MASRLPDFFIVGAAKSGTTALYTLLDSHPEIYMSPIKEPNHFCTDIRPESFSKEYELHEKRKKINLEAYLDGSMREKHFDYFVTRPDQYARLFKNVKDEKAVGESSNSYLFSNVAAQNIRRQLPHARIVIILRNPVERIYSHYLANLRDGKTCRRFFAEIESDFKRTRKGWWISHNYFETGLYGQQVKRYVDAFSADRIKIIRYDDFSERPGEVLVSLLEFLGVAPDFEFPVTKRFNVAREPWSPSLIYFSTRWGLKNSIFRLVPEKARQAVKRFFFREGVSTGPSGEDNKKLLEFYLPDITYLEKITGLDLSSWKQLKPDTDP